MLAAAVLGGSAVCALQTPSPYTHVVAATRCPPPRLADAADGEEEPWSSSLALLSKRISAVRESEGDEQVKALMAAAANWNSGRCAQRPIVILDEWVRRLHAADGILACGTYSGEVVLVDMETGECLENWMAEEPPAGADADASAHAAAHDDAAVAADDVDDELDDDAAEITAIALSNDAQRVLAGDAAGAVVMRERGHAHPIFRAQHRAAVSGVHWDGTSERVYSTSLDARLACHELASGALLEVVALRRPILSMSVCENYCALGLADGAVSIFTLSPLRQILTFAAHKEATTSVNLLSGSQLLSGAADGTVCLWRLDEEADATRRCTTFEGHRGPVVCLQGDGEKVVSGARDGTVRVWEAESGRTRFVLQGFTAYLGSLQVSPTWLLADGTNNAVVMLDFTEEAVRAQEEEEEEDDDDDDDDDGGGLVFGG